MLFSIITITKSNPDGFARTKASVESQDFRDFEWVVIDGAIEPDSGIYDAMNKGLDRARGHYVIFMNAGDVFADEKMLSKIALHAGPDFLYGDALEDGHLKPARHDIRFGMPTHHQAMVYTRGPLRYDTSYKIAADYKFTAQMMRGSVKYLPFSICIYESGGISQRKTALGRMEQALIRRELGIKASLTPFLQTMASALKKISPLFYWALRSAFRTSRA